MSWRKDRATEAVEMLEDVADRTPVRIRTLYRKRGDYLAGWILLSEDVGNIQHHLETVKMILEMIREEGENPEDYEFRIDYAPSVKWDRGEAFWWSENTQCFVSKNTAAWQRPQGQQ